jgi:hypothetical protein
MCHKIPNHTIDIGLVTLQVEILQLTLSNLEKLQGEVIWISEALKDKEKLRTQINKI